MVENIVGASGRRLKLNWRSMGNLKLIYIYGLGRILLLLDEVFIYFSKEGFW